MLFPEDIVKQHIPRQTKQGTSYLAKLHPITNSTETDDNNTSNQSRNTTQSHLMDKTTHSFGVPLVVVFTLIIIIVLVILLVAFRTKIKTFSRNSQNQEHDIEEMDTTVSPLMIGK